MTVTRVKFRDWLFEVDRQLTIECYAKVIGGGSSGCECNECKNYMTFRDKVFPDEVQNLFTELGVHYRKEVEILSYRTLANGLHHIGGWFHFKGNIISGKDCTVPLPGVGNTLNLTKTLNNFEIGFGGFGGLTNFKNKENLVEIEFVTYIPWVIDKSLL